MEKTNKTAVDKYENGAVARKVIFLLLAAVLAFFGAREFVELRNYRETVVVSEAFTERVRLSEYFPGLKGTMGDTWVYIFDSGVPGGSLLVLGGTHPYEPATTLSTYIMMENIEVEKGKVFIIPHANMSASTLGIVGNAYPKYYHIETEWGVQKYRMGDRGTHPLDQWPDPFTYVHYPTGQNLAYEDLRNMNRCYPGRPDGSLTEQMCYGIMELIRNENISLLCDTHEASLMYPVVSTYVAHERAFDMTSWAAMILSQYFPMKCESSPKGLAGLAHRDPGDHSDVLAVLLETPEPFIDRVVGQITEELLLNGRDQFLDIAAKKDLLYTSYSYETGATMEYRVGRHLSGVLEVSRTMGLEIFYPEFEMSVSWPTYQDVMENGCGYYLHDPATADPSRVFTDN